MAAVVHAVVEAGEAVAGQGVLQHCLHIPEGHAIGQAEDQFIGHAAVVGQGVDLQGGHVAVTGGDTVAVLGDEVGGDGDAGDDGAHLLPVPQEGEAVAHREALPGGEGLAEQNFTPPGRFTLNDLEAVEGRFVGGIPGDGPDGLAFLPLVEDAGVHRGPGRDGLDALQPGENGGRIGRDALHRGEYLAEVLGGVHGIHHGQQPGAGEAEADVGGHAQGDEEDAGGVRALPPPDGPQGLFEENHQTTSSGAQGLGFSVTLAMRPSRTTITRSAISAMPALWVMTTTVFL